MMTTISILPDVLTGKLVCPYSGVDYTAPCRVATCPMHLPETRLPNNCLHQVAKEDFSVGNLAEITSEPNDRGFRELVQRQSKKIIDMGKLYRAALDADYSHSCPRCGYKSICKSRELCRSRRDLFSDANKQLENTLLPTEFWYLILHSSVNFLPHSLRLRAAQLVSARDVASPERAT